MICAIQEMRFQTEVLMDIRVISTMGLTDDDVEALTSSAYQVQSQVIWKDVITKQNETDYVEVGAVINAGKK